MVRRGLDLLGGIAGCGELAEIAALDAKGRVCKRRRVEECPAHVIGEGGSEFQDLASVDMSADSRVAANMQPPTNSRIKTEPGLNPAPVTSTNSTTGQQQSIQVIDLSNEGDEQRQSSKSHVW
ncbi:hypothetical protein CLAFUW4_13722 [Fulvia fulva]|uniref:Uncharacterized protein n=1 Tax=Passalora fulva TaxID=5499 RepID=A0A9Q8PL81_PASFU|nr:uncharacterized protein CLAFUR5_13570 [Fulvia fulva]KAK4610080.1 hypothetical protein CLAFUR4_13725 [Fulvia fulva]KAK4611421.1 hypothetical protein CLAFUR0_13729 [Fulvia fulva]UJO24439.1 hypothetical protein CLAFUR5_13570 [Fulvia fulva]WPV21789.1 hypothetical protein CLAFUW4_13722 [Fulvia fulva]WPV36847.1 hypothetical protein CLAFUW7_13730 [Fulvia fulva]